MSTVSDVEDLKRTAKRHRVHYQVGREVTFNADARVAVGFEVRLYAVHDKREHVLPGCPKCIDLLGELRRVAEWLVPHEHRPTVTSIEPFDPALYDSKDVPGADEIALCLRLSHREGYAKPIDACEERCLKEIRERLKILSVPER